MNNTAIAVVAFAIFAVGGVAHFALKERDLAPVSGRAKSLTTATLAAHWGVDASGLDVSWLGMTSHDGGTAVCGRAAAWTPFAVLFREEDGKRRRHVLLPDDPAWEALPTNCRGG